MINLSKNSLELKCVKAKDYCLSVRDGTHDSPKPVDIGFPLVTSKHLKSGQIEINACYQVSEDDYYEIVKRSKVNQWDVLISMIGTIGEVALVKNEPHFAIKNVGLFKSRNEADGKWLYYYLRTDFAQNYLREISRGTTQQYVPLGSLREMPIYVFDDKSEMSRIAHILGTLDDKIENNRKTAKTLEAMAQAIFQSWFVDFDPVRAKMAGESPESICKRLKLMPEILDLFPDRLVDTELGEIPEGWEVGTLGNVAENPRRGIRPQQINPETPYIALEHMPRRCIYLSEWGTGEGLESNKFMFRKNEMLFGKLRPYFHKVGVAPVNGICSTDIVVIAPQSAHWLSFVLGHASSDAFVSYTDSDSTGTKMPRTSWNRMAQYEIALPPESIAKAFDSLVVPTIHQMVANVHESRTLADFRDTLLPKLISGEVHVPEFEKSTDAFINSKT